MTYTVKIFDKEFVSFLSEDQIKKRVAEMADELNSDYAAKRPIFIAILNGAFMFSADLFKKLTIETEICFIKLASYKGVRSTGKVITAIGLDVQLTGRHIVILEDIVDTGKTLHEFLPQLRNHHPASLKVCSLLNKPDAMRFDDVPVDYIGFSIPDKFVVGYGLDYDGLGRNMPYILRLAEESDLSLI